jgi:hypothetical protein
LSSPYYNEFYKNKSAMWEMVKYWHGFKN